MALILVTGGARSGKSGVAERLAASQPSPVTVVVFGDATGDAEMARRIDRHREKRPRAWTTLEAADSRGWRSFVGEGTLVVECLGTLLGLLMAEAADADAEETALARVAAGAIDTSRRAEIPQGYEEEVESRFGEVLDWIERREGDSIVVSNEVGASVVPAYPSGRVFRDVLGRANRRLADAADAAWLVVAGRCIDLAALPREIAWPETEEGSR